MGQRVNYKVRELKKWIRVILLLNCGQDWHKNWWYDQIY